MLQTAGNPTVSKIFSNENLLLSIVILLAIILRLPLLHYFDVVTPDGVVLIEIAKTFTNGDFFVKNIPEHHHEPLYPALISIFSAITSLDYIRSGQIISLLAAIITIYLVYKLSAKIYNPKIGIYSALILSLVPLHAFYSVMVLKEAIYILMVLFTIYFYVNAVKYQAKKYFILTGLFLGISYLGRFDGILLLLIIPFLYYIAMGNPPFQGNRRYLLLTIGMTLCIYVIFMTVLFVQTGKITISKKLIYYINPIIATNTAKEKLFRDYGHDKAEEIIRNNSQWKGYIAKRTEGLYKNIHYVLPFVFPTLLMLLAGIGLSGFKFTKIEMLLLMVPLIYLFIFPFLKYPDDYRYILCITPFLSIFAGKGLCFLQEKFFYKHLYLHKIAVVMFLIIFVPLVFKPVLDGSTYRELLLYKKIGLYIDAHAGSEKRLNIMSASPITAFYAQANHIPMNSSNDSNDIIMQIKDDDVDFVITTDDLTEVSGKGHIAPLQIKEANQFNDTSGRKMRIFRIAK